jgi:hypothetical protein
MGRIIERIDHTIYTIATIKEAKLMLRLAPSEMTSAETAEDTQRPEANARLTKL